MSDKKYVKLIMVSANNNNKFYEMIYEGGSNFTVKYGRVEKTTTTKTYPYSKWKSKYDEKIEKGYKDVTHLSSVVIKENSSSNNIGVISDPVIEQFITKMQNYTNKLVSSTYSVKSENVTKQQIDEAQKLINELVKLDRNNEKNINNKLIELYTTIPRHMYKVQQYLLPTINIEKTLIQEQDNLDAMASQVNMGVKDTSKNESISKSILDVLGITMKECDVDVNLDYLVKQLKNTRYTVKKIFKVDKPAENEIFNRWLSNQRNPQTRVLIHGTRCTSVIPIIEQGLKIRPTGNFSYSGKAYGDGNYFSEVVNKSLNYTGHDNDKILLVYEVHVGNPFIYNGWYKGNSFTLEYSELNKRGYDSTYVKAGNGLLNSEIIVYKEQQSKLQNIIWL